ncbi:MAG: hypothetical protein NT033_05385, partial [Candidatus Omnitrophica bacterium]|nr:hypothetical protein [Candidatus Omnitrophota bacterium]
MLKNSRLNRILAFLAIGVFFSLIATMFFLRLEIEDVWFHIKIGEQIVKHGVLPFYDTFSYTSSNIRWLATQWLGEVILFFTYNSFGLVGLQLFRCLYFTAVLLLLFFFIRRTLSISSAFLIIIPVSFIFAQRYFSRPFIFNILFVLLYLYILTSHHRDPFKKVVLAIPFLHFIWQNIYIGGAYISLFLLAVFLAG